MHGLLPHDPFEARGGTQPISDGSLSFCTREGCMISTGAASSWLFLYDAMDQVSCHMHGPESQGFFYSLGGINF